MSVLVVFLILCIIFYKVNQKYPNAFRKHIHETKVTCKMCNTEWYFQKIDKKRAVRNKKMKSLTSLHALGEIASGHGHAGVQESIMAHNIINHDLNRCPKCGSRNVFTEKVVHLVNE